MFADVLWAREFNKHSYDIIIIITFMIIDNLNYASSSGFCHRYLYMWDINNIRFSNAVKLHLSS